MEETGSRKRRVPPERGILDAMEDLESKRRSKKDKPAQKKGEKSEPGDELDLDKVW